MEGQGRIKRSLRWRLCLVLIGAGGLAGLAIGAAEYDARVTTLETYLDEELAQVAALITEDELRVPRRWRAPAEGGDERPRPGPSRFRSLLPWPSPADLFAARRRDIIVAPLYVPPGETFYLPQTLADGWYTVLINDRRVRVYLTTTPDRTRFVVARPLALVTAYAKRAARWSVFEGLVITLLLSLVSVIATGVLFRPVRRLADQVAIRAEDDLRALPTQAVPAELDVFMQALNQLLRRIAQARDRERQFVTAAAHELRTPLTALALQVENLQAQALPPAIGARVAALGASLQRQSTLTAELLALARLQSAPAEVGTDFAVRDVLINVIDELGTTADRQGIDLGLTGACAGRLHAERRLVHLAVRNLCDNALRYTPPGGRCDLSCELTAAGAVITVDDTGPGLPAEALAHAGTPFYRVGGDTAAPGGHGLGLALVTAACRRLGGVLRLSNRDGGGLRAQVTLPGGILRSGTDGRAEGGKHAGQRGRGPHDVV